MAAARVIRCALLGILFYALGVGLSAALMQGHIREHQPDAEAFRHPVFLGLIGVAGSLVGLLHAGVAPHCGRRSRILAWGVLTGCAMTAGLQWLLSGPPLNLSLVTGAAAVTPGILLIEMLPELGRRAKRSRQAG